MGEGSFMKIKYGIKCKNCSKIYHYPDDVPQYCKRCGATLWNQRWPQLGYHKYPELVQYGKYSILFNRCYKYDVTPNCVFVKIRSKFPYIYWKELKN